MSAAVLDTRAWGASVAVHAAVVALFAALLGAGHHHHHEETPPARLVWVEPAAPRLGRPDAPPVPAPPAAPEPRIAPPVSVEPVARPAPVAPAAPLVRSPRPKRETRPTVQRAAPPRGVPAPSAAAVDTNEIPQGAAIGGAAGTRLGTVGGVGDAPLPVGAVAAPPELLERVMPEYPARARDREIEGQVLLEVVLDRQGRPERDIKVRRSIALLDEAAIAAVRQWRFRPARDADGKPVRVIMDVPVRFELR